MVQDKRQSMIDYLSHIPWNEILVMFLLAAGENATHTLASRARNSNSIRYHAIAASIANTFYLLAQVYLIRALVLNLDRYDLLLTYLVSSVAAATTMHWVAMRFLEKDDSKALMRKILPLAWNGYSLWNPVQYPSQDGKNLEYHKTKEDLMKAEKWAGTKPDQSGMVWTMETADEFNKWIQARAKNPTL